MSNIQDKIQEAIADAKAACSLSDGSNAGECASAWDTVEELQAEAAHQRQNQPKKTALQQYCEDNPDAAECRIYDD